MGAEGEVVVRPARAEDAGLAPAASALIRAAARDNDIAERSVEWLRAKIEHDRAVVALRKGELVGFGYWSEWEGGRFISHSGLVVRPELRGRGVGRELKKILVEASRRAFPKATLMSLTTSPQVKALNLSFGFRVVPLDRLTKDEAFWKGCETCRNFAEVKAKGERCCCEGMILEPG
jgi:N-acetylglutamate synthase-like GNAT family acetyltransferase